MSRDKMLFLRRRWTCRSLHEAFRRDNWAIYVQTSNVPSFRTIKYYVSYAAGITALVPYGNHRRSEWAEVVAWLNATGVKVHFPRRGGRT